MKLILAMMMMATVLMAGTADYDIPVLATSVEVWSENERDMWLHLGTMSQTADNKPTGVISYDGATDYRLEKWSGAAWAGLDQYQMGVFSAGQQCSIYGSNEVKIKLKDRITIEVSDYDSTTPSLHKYLVINGGDSGVTAGTLNRTMLRLENDYGIVQSFRFPDNRDATINFEKPTAGYAASVGSSSGNLVLIQGSGTDIATMHMSSNTVSGSGIKVVFNENSYDADFRVEGNGDANLLFCDGGNDRVGIGTATPAQMLDISSTAPNFQMTDTTGSAKSLRVVTDSNVTSFYEAAGAAGDILSLQLSSKYVGIGTASPASPLHVIEQSNLGIRIQNPTYGTWEIHAQRPGLFNDGFAIYDRGNTAIRFSIDTVGVITMPVYGAGTATFSAAGVISSVSDEKLKEIKRGFDLGIDGIMDVNPIVYSWRPEANMENEKTKGTEYIGFSAQNVQKALGEIAVGHNQDGTLSVQDRAIMAAMVNAIKEQQERIEQQDKAISALERRLAIIEKP